MAMMELRLKPTSRELRQFGVAALVVFGLLGGWAAWRGSLFGINLGQSAMTVATVIWIVGALAGLSSLAFPKANLPLYVVLTLITFPIGLVVSYVMLAFVFYGLFTPVGLWFRLIGRDPLHRKLDPNAESYWIPHSAPKSTDRYFKQY